MSSPAAGSAQIPTSRFVLENGRWLAAGFLLALASSFGQTFFIALSAEPIRTDFGLTHGEFGMIYMIGTLTSALALIQFGKLVDFYSARVLALVILAALALVCLGMATASHSWMLFVLIFGLRFCGQGMLSHIAMTAMARWFSASRGRALAIAALGYPVGEALAPQFFRLLAIDLGLSWREVWLAAIAILLVGFAPAVWALLRRERSPRGQIEAETSTGLHGRHWTRAEVLRTRLFWLLALGVIGPSFYGTVLFFLPAHIAEIKGWELGDWLAGYSFYAVVSVFSAMGTGILIDCFSARALLGFYQLPMAVGMALFVIAEPSWMIVPLMAAFGVSAGAVSTVHSALWAELYGTRHLGAIKAFAHALMVFGSAAGPGVAGLLIDAGVDFEGQAVWYAVYVLAISTLFAVLSVRLRAPHLTDA
ncbi:MAG: MFS transporter [Pseudomonadota bacterium]